MPPKRQKVEGVKGELTWKVSTRKTEILGDLKELHERLSLVSQDPKDRPRDLKAIAAYLASDRIISSTDKEVRLLAACCLVDVLRIFAPEAPYNDTELIKVFRVITAQLRGFASNDHDTFSGSKIFYILNSLSVVKSCVVLVFLAQTGNPEAEELYLSMFDAVVSSVRPDHSDEVTTHMASIMQSCLEESEVIEQEVLETILLPLLPPNKAENSAAYNLCSNVLRRSFASIQESIAKLVNDILVGSLPRSEISSSELADDIYAIVFELHRVSPNMLLTILPNVCLQLQVDDEGVRLKAVKLLGRLFSSQIAEYGIDFAKNFKDFLGRFHDVSVAVRHIAS